jgi:regulator of protease activity HflC (stomatin/prohibitin superfamily)
MSAYVIIAVVGVVALVVLCAAVRILKQYESGVQFRLGRLKGGPRGPGLIFIIPLVDHVRREGEGAQRAPDAPRAGSVANGAGAPLAGIAASWEAVR